MTSEHESRPATAATLEGNAMPNQCEGHCEVDEPHPDKIMAQGVFCCGCCRLRKPIEYVRADSVDEEIRRLELCLKDAGMSVRRLLRIVRKHEPNAKIVGQMQGWLERNSLQGSILRDGATP